MSRATPAECSRPAPGTRTSELLPPLPPALKELLTGAGTAAAPGAGPGVPPAQPLGLLGVEEPQDAPEVRWGVLGAGHIARTFATDVPDFSSGRVVAVGSRDPARAQALLADCPRAGKGRPVRVYHGYEEMLGDPEVDAVYVATPHAFHRDHALAAVEAGKPVLVEKAFTRSAAQAREVLAAAQARDLFVMEAMWTRFLPGQVLLRALLAAGALGGLRYLRADHHQPISHVERLARPELAGGSLLDLGVYPISVIHSVLGAPQHVAASGHLSPEGVDRDLVAVLSYPEATATASCGMEGRSGTSAEITGTTGRLELPARFYRPSPLYVHLEGSRDAVCWDATVPGGFQFQAAEVGRCLAAGRQQSPVMPWQATVEVLDVMDEARRQVGVVYPGEREQ